MSAVWRVPALLPATAATSTSESMPTDIFSLPWLARAWPISCAMTWAISSSVA